MKAPVLSPLLADSALGTIFLSPMYVGNLTDLILQVKPIFIPAAVVYFANGPTILSNTRDALLWLQPIRPPLLVHEHPLSQMIPL